jgi:hypothetical protein
LESNPYAPPLAAVQDAPPNARAIPPFFAVSLFKLALMCFCTLGFYQLYWFYKQWQAVRRREYSNVLPAARALFAIFFCYPLFKRVRQRGIQLGIEPRLQAGVTAIGYIVCSLAGFIPNPLGWLVLVAIFLLLPVQAHANKINAIDAPAHDRNDKLSGWNWAVIVPIGLMILMAIVGSMLPQGY